MRFNWCKTNLNPVCYDYKQDHCNGCNILEAYLHGYETGQEDAPTIDAVQVVRCKDCKYFELDHFDRINGIPLITAHEICTKWSGGSKTSKDGFCFLGERKNSESEVEE